MLTGGEHRQKDETGEGMKIIRSFITLLVAVVIVGAVWPAVAQAHEARVLDSRVAMSPTASEAAGVLSSGNYRMAVSAPREACAAGRQQGQGDSPKNSVATRASKLVKKTAFVITAPIWVPFIVCFVGPIVEKVL